MRVTLLTTCMVDVFEPEVGVAAVRLLRASGCDVTCSREQTCCGQPAWNSGFAADAAKVAKTTLRALEMELDEGAEAVVVPAGSCAAMVRVFWPELFEVTGDHDAATRARRVGERTKELTEFLAQRDDRLPPLALPEPQQLAWHHGCHLLRELRVRDEPRQLLDKVAGCELVSWSADERCCGFGGMFSFKLPETSEAMADDKLASLRETNADAVVSADSSCLVHLRGRAEAEHEPIHTLHIAEVLAAALPRP